MSPEPRSGYGFSLVEMVVALAIFSISVTATLGLFAVCLRSTATSVGHTRAVFLAQGLLEEALAQDEPQPLEEGDDFGEEFPGAWWSRRIEVTETDGLYDVHVEVNWPDAGKVRSVEFASLLAER